MNTFREIILALLAAAIVAYFALAVSACGQRVMPKTPDGKVYSSNKY